MWLVFQYLIHYFIEFDCIQYLFIAFAYLEYKI
jgi:hypothetical protein